jgi:hypothetical protein
VVLVVERTECIEETEVLVVERTVCIEETEAVVAAGTDIRDIEGSHVVFQEQERCM